MEISSVDFDMNISGFGNLPGDLIKTMKNN